MDERALFGLAIEHRPNDELEPLAAAPKTATYAIAQHCWNLSFEAPAAARCRLLYLPVPSGTLMYPSPRIEIAAGSFLELTKQLHALPKFSPVTLRNDSDDGRIMTVTFASVAGDPLYEATAPLGNLEETIWGFALVGRRYQVRAWIDGVSGDQLIGTILLSHPDDIIQLLRDPAGEITVQVARP
jgi:hypothetical protein